MATRKDQLDAFVFARRRMVANLVAPSPTGSDEAAPRPVKTFFTSAILSAIAVAGVAVLGVFKPSAPSGWQNGLAVDSSTGAAYVYSPQDHELHPVLNITSAQLLLGDHFKKFDVPADVINGQNETIGAPYGIPGAPPDVPRAGNVDLTQWTLCVKPKNAANQTIPGGKTYLEIGYGQGGDLAFTPSLALFVHDDSGRNYMVTGDYAYPIAEDNLAINPLTTVSVGVGNTIGPWVSSAWLGAFEQGKKLQLPTVPGIGSPVPSTLSGQPGHTIGDYGKMIGANGQQVGYIETRDGLVEVNFFVYTLYIAQKNLEAKGAHLMQLTSSQVTTASPIDERTNPHSLTGAGSNWPQNLVTPVDSDGQSAGFGAICVNYSGAFDGDVPRLVIYNGNDLPQPIAQGAGVLQSGGPSYANTVLVRPGHAALARDVSGGDSQNVGAEYLVPDTGVRYRMAPTATVIGSDGKPAATSAVKQLQYGDVKVTPVPGNWMSLIQAGSVLDPTNAGTTPPLVQ